MGFFRDQEEKLAMRLIVWQYEKTGVPLPPADTLRRMGKTLVADAHRIARQRGQNVVGIVKELAADLMKKR